MQNDKHPPPLDPNMNKGESQPVQKEEKNWKREFEIPEPTTSQDKTHTPSGSSDNPRKDKQPEKPEVEKTGKEQQQKN